MEFYPENLSFLRGGSHARALVEFPEQSADTIVNSGVLCHGHGLRPLFQTTGAPKHLPSKQIDYDLTRPFCPVGNSAGLFVSFFTENGKIEVI